MLKEELAGAPADALQGDQDSPTLTTIDRWTAPVFNRWRNSTENRETSAPAPEQSSSGGGQVT